VICLRYSNPTFAEDGYDETLVPLDYAQNGQIRDDDLFKALVGKFREGVYCTFVMDCCHSGSVLDLPYQFAADGQSDSMTIPDDFNFGPLLSLAQNVLADGDVDAEDFMKIASQCCNIL
jgi:Caspase domain